MREPETIIAALAALGCGGVSDRCARSDSCDKYPVE
jgi:hypothetical protein